MRTAQSDAEAIGQTDATPEAQGAIHELIDGITVAAINSDEDASDALGVLEDKMRDDSVVSGSDVLTAWISGIHAGSVAVARKWVKASRVTAGRYYARPDDL